MNSFEISTRSSCLTGNSSSSIRLEMNWKESMFSMCLFAESHVNYLLCVCVYIATFIVVFVAVSCWGYCCCCYCCLWCCELDKFSSQLTNLPRLTRCLYYITQFTLRYICTKAIKHTLLMLIQYTWYTYITYTCCYIHYT